jgi:hypothetical protein
VTISDILRRLCTAAMEKVHVRADERFDMSEIQKLAAAFLGEIRNLEATAENILTKPAIAPFLPLIEQAVGAVLKANGVPVPQVETAAVQIYTVINSLLTAAATVNAVTPTVTPTEQVAQ